MRYKFGLILFALALGGSTYFLAPLPTLAQTGADNARNVILREDARGVIYRDGPFGEVINNETEQVFTGQAARDIQNNSRVVGRKTETPQERQSREQRATTTQSGICDNIFSLTNFASGGGGWGACLSGIVYVFSVGLASPFAYVGAYLLEYMLAFSLNGATYADPVISTGWQVVRDLSNMLFIFLLVYVSFSVILGTESAQVRKLLANVIIAALIINFSFFLTRLMIDAGNLLALQIYSAIEIKDTQTKIQASQKGRDLSIFGFTITHAKPITNSIMAGVGLQKLISGDMFTKWVKNNDFFTTLITLSFIFLTMGAMLAMLAYAFFAAAIKLVVRVVTLWFTIILAPFAVVAWALPKTRTFAMQWWKYHINAILFPVGFLFVFYILALFMGPVGAEGGLFAGVFAETQNLGSIEGIASTVASVAIRVIFVIVMLWTAIKVGDYFSVYGAAKINSFAKKHTIDRIERWGKKGGGYAYGLTVASGAAVVNKAVKESHRYGDILNSAPFDFLRRKTVERAAEARPGGGRTVQELRDVFRADRVRRSDQRAANLQREANRVFVDEAGQGVLRTADIPNFQKIRGDELLKLIPAEKLMGNEKLFDRMTSEQLSDYSKSDKLNAFEKKDVHDTWHDRANDAPHQKANEELAELKKISNVLKLELEAIRAGNRIDEKKIEELRDAIDERMRGTEGNLGDVRQKLNMALQVQKDLGALATKEQREAAEKRVNDLKTERAALDLQKDLLKKAVKRLDKADERRKDVPAVRNRPPKVVEVRLPKGGAAGSPPPGRPTTGPGGPTTPPGGGSPGGGTSPGRPSPGFIPSEGGEYKPRTSVTTDAAPVASQVPPRVTSPSAFTRTAGDEDTSRVNVTADSRRIPDSSQPNPRASVTVDMSTVPLGPPPPRAARPNDEKER